jgi:hypothetical protein
MNALKLPYSSCRWFGDRSGAKAIRNLYAAANQPRCTLSHVTVLISRRAIFKMRQLSRVIAQVQGHRFQRAEQHLKGILSLGG